MVQPTHELLRGPRGRRVALECVKHLNDAVRQAVSWRAHALDPNPGTLLRLSTFCEPDTTPAVTREPKASAPESAAAPSYSEAEVVARIQRTDVTRCTAHTIREALRVSVGAARYWQACDGDDVLAASPLIRAALTPMAEHIVALAPDLAAPRAHEQWAVDWRAIEENAPLNSGSETTLTRWAHETRAEETRAARERPEDPNAHYSGTWWSVPQNLLMTRAQQRDALELVEDAHGCDVATLISVRGSGRVFEVRSSADWAQLCRVYPCDVTASRRHDWFRVTGRDGAWVIPDWQQVAQRWDAVHLTTLGYLSAATREITVDAHHSTVIAGWAPDSTLWLTDTAREWGEPRQQWRLPDEH